MSKICSEDSHLAEDWKRSKGETYDLLNEHLTSHGAEIDKTSPFEFEHENYAMTAKVDIHPGDTIVYIPHDLIITYDVAMTAQVNLAIQSGMRTEKDKEKFRT